MCQASEFSIFPSFLFSLIVCFELVKAENLAISPQTHRVIITSLKIRDVVVFS